MIDTHRRQDECSNHHPQYSGNALHRAYPASADAIVAGGVSLGGIRNAFAVLARTDWPVMSRGTPIRSSIAPIARTQSLLRAVAQVMQPDRWWARRGDEVRPVAR
jgi:hypothetical protein